MAGGGIDEGIIVVSARCNVLGYSLRLPAFAYVVSGRLNKGDGLRIE